MKKVIIILLTFLILLPGALGALNNDKQNMWRNETDSFGSLDLTPVGVTHRVTGNGWCVYEDCYDYDGTGDYLQRASYNITTNNFTIAWWFNSSVAQTSGDFDRMITIANGATSEGLAVFFSGFVNNQVKVRMDSSDGANTDLDYVSALGTTRHHFAVNYVSGSILQLFVDGVQVANRSIGTNSHLNSGKTLRWGCRWDGTECADGVLDEMYVWNQAKSVAEINDLYNNEKICLGDPCSFTVPATGVTLQYPDPFTETASIDMRLNVSQTELNNTALHTAQLYWNNTWYDAQVLENASGYVQFNLTIATPLFDINKSLVLFTWNYSVINTTGRESSNVSANHTVTFGYYPINVSLLGLVAETELQSIAGNFNKLSSIVQTDNFTVFYNGSFVFRNLSAHPTTFNNSYYTPTNNNQSNARFNVSLNSSFSYNGKSVTREFKGFQNITSITATNCSLASNPEIIYLLRDASVPTQAKTGTIDMTLTSWASNRSVNVTSSFAFAGTDAYGICFNYVSSDFHVDSIQLFTTPNAVIRTYFLRNATFDPGDTTNISLYNLNTTLSSNIIVNVRDGSDNPLEDYYVQALRYYPSEDVLRTVEIGVTDTNGETLVHMVGFDVFYKFIITDSFGRVVKVTNAAKIQQGTINLQVLTSDEFIETLKKVDAITYSLSYNNVTEVAQLTFSDENNIVNQAFIKATKHTALGEQTLCQSSVMSTSGTIYCSIANQTGDIQIQAYVVLKSGKNEPLHELNVDTFSDVFGLLGPTILFFEFMIVVCVGLFHPAPPIIFGLLTIFANIALGIIPWGYNTFMILAIIGGIVIHRLRT